MTARRRPSFDGVAGYYWSANMHGRRQPERCRPSRHRRTRSMCSGVDAAPRPRLHAPTTGVRAGRDAVVLSYSLLAAAIRRRPGIVGRTVQIDGKPYTVIGVMPAAVRVCRSVQLQGRPVGAAADRSRERHGNRRVGGHTMSSRRPADAGGMSYEKAQADLDIIDAPARIGTSGDESLEQGRRLVEMRRSSTTRWRDRRCSSSWRRWPWCS